MHGVVVWVTLSVTAYFTSINVPWGEDTYLSMLLRQRCTFKEFTDAIDVHGADINGKYASVLGGEISLHLGDG